MSTDRKQRRLHTVRWITRILRVFPAALEAGHLRWALQEIDPLHPDVPLIVRRISYLESQS